MKQINIAKAMTEAKGMTQAFHVRTKQKRLTVQDAMAPQVFSSTYMASLSGDFLFEIGTGQIDAIQHTRMLLQYAADTGSDMTTVSEEFIAILMRIGYSPETFRHIIAGIIGTSDKPTGKNRIPSVTPTYVLSLVKKQIPDAPEIMAHMVSDYVCHMIKPLGWIIPDNSYTYRMKRTASFPHYDSLVDIVKAFDVSKVMQALADADLSLVKSAAEKNGAISPGMVAQYLSHALVTAYDRTRGSYDSEAVVRSVLTVMGRVWSPYTPEALQPVSRVANSPVVNDLRTNLAIFLSYQDMIGRKNLKPELYYGDEEMASVILPFFAEAMASVSPFKRRILSDVISFMGKQTSADHMGQPDHVILYEDWDFASEISAFVPVKQTARGEQRYLDVQQHVSGALSSAMRPIRSSINVQRMVDERLATYDMVPSAQKGMPGKASMTIGFPSVLEREVFHRLDAGVLPDSIMKGTVPVENEQPIISEDVFTSMLYDYYAQIAHVAVAKSDSVSVSAERGQTGQSDVSNLFLAFSLATTLKRPVGQTAIHLGRITTTEPLEALVYVPDFKPTEALKVEELPLEDHRESVHIWRWFAASDRLNFETSYTTQLRNNTYMVVVDEHEMLGLGRRRENVYFLRPLVAAAIARMWMNWHTEDTAFIAKQISGTKDQLVVDAFEGKKVRNAMHMASMLASIGSEGSGSNAARFAEQRIVDQMYAKGNVDDYAELHVGIQKHRLSIWAGMTAMEMLGLLDKKDANKILDYLRETNALSLIVGTSHYSA